MFRVPAYGHATGAGELWAARRRACAAWNPWPATLPSAPQPRTEVVPESPVVPATHRGDPDELGRGGSICTLMFPSSALADGSRSDRCPL